MPNFGGTKKSIMVNLKVAYSIVMSCLSFNISSALQELLIQGLASRLRLWTLPSLDCVKKVKVSLDSLIPVGWVS